jgi:predicted O-methyltransferase YrrM
MKKVFSAFYYLRYRLTATNTHGVHSPFVFDLLNTVVYNKVEYYSFSEIEALRLQLLQNQTSLTCIDLGAGSRTSTGSARSIMHITRYAAKPAKYAQLLFRLVNHFQPGHILELGTSMGISTCYMAKANNQAMVTTIEGCPEIAQAAEQNFRKLDIKNIRQVIGNFDDVLPEVLKQTPKTDFVFFDGNHRKEATLNYFSQCLNKADEQSVFVFDDIYWSPQMKEAWDEIKNHPRVTVTIDLFFIGIVFFRKEQVKQHFVIRF